jgi:hypothetical protein
MGAPKFFFSGFQNKFSDFFKAKKRPKKSGMFALEMSGVAQVGGGWGRSFLLHLS